MCTSQRGFRTILHYRDIDSASYPHGRWGSDGHPPNKNKRNCSIKSTPGYRNIAPTPSQPTPLRSAAIASLGWNINNPRTPHWTRFRGHLLCIIYTTDSTKLGSDGDKLGGPKQIPREHSRIFEVESVESHRCNFLKQRKRYSTALFKLVNVPAYIEINTTQVTLRWVG